MERNPVERFGFLLHRVAYYLIRRSLQRRLRRMGMHQEAAVEDFAPVELWSHANDVCMECMEGDFEVMDDLDVIRQDRRRVARRTAMREQAIARRQRLAGQRRYTPA